MRIALFLALLLYGTPAFLQPIGKRSNLPLNQKKAFSLRTTGIEICNNNIDDDGNGLVDCKDFSCYFKQGDPQCACFPMNLIWIGDARGDLYWIDVNTSVEKKVGSMQNVMNDITWTPQGKLYGLNENGVFEINPATGESIFSFPIPGYNPLNALISDGAGNLYMSALTPDFLKQLIIKYNVFTNQVTQIADLTAAGLISAGDLAFSGGVLFLACAENKIAKINVNNGAIQVANIVGLPSNTFIFGIVSVAGGSLYISDVNKLYSLDTVSYRATLAYTSNSGMFIYGMANYNDFCNAPKLCKATVKINIQSAPPYCSLPGVTLKADGQGVNGSTAYSWLLPDGSTQNTQSLVATKSGKYSVRYHTIPDTCEAWDTIAVHLVESPSAKLGADTFFCQGSQIMLEARDTTDVTHWLWSNGSTTPQIFVNQNGQYWVQLSNGCGVSRDTITISEMEAPQVELGSEVYLCPGEVTHLKNLQLKKGPDHYLWSNGSSSDSITVNSGGIYWLESSNACGKARDSVVVHMKDSCSCNPVYPMVELGSDRELCKFDTLIVRNALHDAPFRYVWSDGSSKSFIVVETPGKYSVNVTTYCGTVTDSILITPKLSGCECNVFVPNAFSPVNKSSNQRFRLLSNCFLRGEIFIYNRWGQLIYHSADLQSGWDGRFKGEPQAAGTYVFQARYRFNNRPGNYTEKGTFILVR